MDRVLSDRLNFFQKGITRISLTEPLNVMLKNISNSLVESFKANLVVVFVYDPEEDSLKPIYHFLKPAGEALDELFQKETGRSWQDHGISPKNSHSSVAEVFTTGQPIWGKASGFKFPSEDIKRWVAKMIEWYNLTAFSILPIAAEGERYGVLIMDTPLEEDMDPLYKNILSACAAQIAIVLKNARIFQNLAREKRHLASELSKYSTAFNLLFRMSEKIALSLSYKDLLQGIREIKDVPSIDIWGIFLHLKDRPELVLYSKFPLDNRLVKESLKKILKPFNTISGRTTRLEDVRVRTETCKCEDSPGPGNIQVFLSIPIIVNQEVEGIFYVASTSEKFTDEEIRFFQTIALQTSLAIERARIFEKREEKLLKALIEGIPDGIVLFDKEGELAIANSKGLEFTRNLCDCSTHGEKRCILHSLIRDLMESGVRGIDREIFHMDRYFITRASIVNLPGQGNDRKGVAVTIADITDRKLIQEQLFQTSKLAAIGELAAGVAHEINNPLTAVLGFSELLLMDAEDKESKELLEKIREQANRAKEIVVSLLGLARAQRVGEGAMDLNTVVSQAVGLIRRQLEADGIELLEEYSPGLPKIRGHAGNLQQVVLNLIQNAHDMIRLHNKGSKVVVRTTSDSERVILEVEDDGPGISEEIKDKIFNPFFTTKPPNKGTGLGLSISHKIVQDHDGVIKVFSKAGEGARFRIELPIREVEKALLLPGSEKEQALDHEDGIKILVVDDEPMVLDVIKRMLTTHGYVADGVTSGKEALEVLKRGSYDVILLDLKMPGMSGQEVYERLCKLDPELSKRVVFVSGDVISKEVVEFCQESEQPFILKPFSSSDLLAAVNKIRNR